VPPTEARYAITPNPYGQRHVMRLIISALACILAAGSFLHATSAADSSCVIFESPVAGSIIATPQCTISASVCGQVSAVVFEAHYPVADAKGDTTLLLGRVTRGPFKIGWNTATVPNQLYKGMSFSADALLRNGEHVLKTVSGVFITDKPVSTPLATIPCSASEGYPLFSRTMSEGRSPLSVHLSASWTTTGIRFIAGAEAPGIFKESKRGKREETGLEICIDPGISRKPFPPPEAFRIIVPLQGKPFKTTFRAAPGPQGTFDIAVDSEQCDCPVEIIMESPKGFTASVLIPATFFGPALPDSFGCNVIARLSDDNDRIVRLSWIDAPSSTVYSPFLWAAVVRLPGPLYGNLAILGLLAFGAGLVLALAVGLIVLFIRKRSMSFTKFEQSEEEKTLADQIYQAIADSVTSKDLSLAAVTDKVAVPPGKVERLIRKHKGKSFRDFVMFLRVEIAKERLRSSHSNAASIADSCGFRNVVELEKYFRKFCRTTPACYRKDNQVT